MIWCYGIKNVSLQIRKSCLNLWGKPQQVRAFWMSLNRYLKSHTLQFHSVYQSDTAFLIIRCKDNANKREAQNDWRQNALQKSINRKPKDGLLQAKRRPFATALTINVLQAELKQARKRQTRKQRKPYSTLQEEPGRWRYRPDGDFLPPVSY